jgi:hypothetical protein
MDYAMWNSILATTTFPPPDAWFSDGRVNYYYFGWVIAATLAKLTGAAPGVAYNLASHLPLTGVAGLRRVERAPRRDDVHTAPAREARRAVAPAAAVPPATRSAARPPPTPRPPGIVGGAAPRPESWGDALTRRSER